MKDESEGGGMGQGDWAGKGTSAEAGQDDGGVANGKANE